MAYNPKDHYFKKAKELNFAARSVFKLEEIDKKFRIFKPGQTVLDLGCSPGSWSQYSSKQVGQAGRVLGVDLSPVTVQLSNATFLQADLRDLQLEDVFKEQGFIPPFDLVLSDMAPKTTGIKMTDQARSVELCQLALDVAQKFLKPGGHFVCKLFHCDEYKTLRDQIVKGYAKFETVKPESTRSISKEVFLVGIRKR